MKRILSMLLTVLLIAALFSSCTGKGGTGETTTTTAATTASGATTTTTGAEETTQTEAETDPAKKYYVSDTPLELTIHMLAWDKYAFDNEWPVWKKAAEMTNVTLKGTVSATASDSQEAFNIMIATREIPDIVCGVRDDFNKYGPEGAFLALNNLIEEHAPNLEAFFEFDPDARRYMTSPDHNIYCINYVMDGYASEGWFIRKDWLDKLDLEVPTNIDEFYTVMKAFREEDPNENGKRDEVPFFHPDARNGVLTLASFWGLTRFTRADENDRIFYGRYDDRYKLAIATIAQWYKEELIDQEIFSRGWEAREFMFGYDVGGCTHYWFGSTLNYNNDERIIGRYPDFNIQWMPPPMDIYGNVKEWSAREIYMVDGWAVSANNSYPVETMKFFDFWWTEEGRRLANFGLEGEQYEMVEGKAMFRDLVLNDTVRVDEQLWNIGAQLNWGFKMDYEYEVQWLNPNAKEAVRAYIENDWIVPPMVSLSFTEEEQLLMDEISEPIFTYTNEMTINWILGNQSVEATWDNYVARLKELRVDEFLQIQQDAYDRYLAN